MSNIITPSFRVSYPNVFKAKRNELNGKDEYTLVALFPFGKDAKEMEGLKKAVNAAIIEKWSTDQSKWPKNLRNPLRDQAEREKEGKLPDGYTRGHIMLNLKSTQRPGLVNQNREDIIDETEFYAGCWARASIRAFAYDQKGNRGVSFGLQNLQKVKDGDPLSGRAKAQDEFSAVDLGDDGASNPIFD